MKYIDEKEQDESSESKVKVNAMKMVLNFHVLLFRIQQATEFWASEATPLMISQNTVDMPLEYLEVLLGTSGRKKSLPALADHLS